MSRRETPMTVWYWEQVGGTLIEEFCAVEARAGVGRRLLDGLILADGPKERLPLGSRRVSLKGRDVRVVQAKNVRLGMYLMGQTLFSKLLVERLGARCIEAVALCSKDDMVLRPLLKAHEGLRVIVCPPEVCGKTAPRGPESEE